MTKYRILPYRAGSASAKALAVTLGGKRLRLTGGAFQPRTGDVIINWGNTTYAYQSQWGYDFDDQILNHVGSILEASNKLKFFELCKEHCPDVIPRFWTHESEVPADAYPVVCRTQLAGHSGAGIVIAGDPSELIHAPLYVKYIKKKDEYRVHIGRINHVSCGSQTGLEGTTGEGGQGGGYLPGSEAGNESELRVIAIQRKARRQDCENPDWQVRNHANGFVYVRNDVNPPASVTEVALQSFRATSLDFGAVDVIYNAKKDRSYVLETNTAPGLQGQTIEDYANFFRSLNI